MMPKQLRAGMAAVALVALTATAAGAAEERPRKYSTLRLCDPTACYVAWSVVGSDHDGVCDAAELRAGTDPYDPVSRPDLKLIAEMLTARQLPSFEYRLATLILMPAEIMNAREELGVDLLGAFPVNERADTLTRLGISAEKLAEYGISPDRDGFALGLDDLRQPDAPAEVRVSGIKVSLISAGGTRSPLNHVFGGGVVDVDSNWQGGTVRTYADGSPRPSPRSRTASASRPPSKPTARRRPTRPPRSTSATTTATCWAPGPPSRPTEYTSGDKSQQSGVAVVGLAQV